MTIFSTLRNRVNRGVNATINAARSAARSTSNFIRDSVAQTAGYARDTATGAYNRFANSLASAPRQRLAQAMQNNLHQADRNNLPTAPLVNLESPGVVARLNPPNRFAEAFRQQQERLRQQRNNQPVIHSIGPAPNGFETVDDLDNANYVEFFNPRTGQRSYEDANRFIKIDTRESEDNIFMTRDSDEELQEKIDNEDLERRFLRALPQRPRQQSDTGGFFPLFLKPDVPYDFLKDYGIYKSWRWKISSKKPYDVNCFLNCLKPYVDENLLKQVCFNNVTRKCELDDICNKLNIGIDLKCFKIGKIVPERYGSDKARENKIIHLGIYLNHYFINDTLFGIKPAIIKHCLWRDERDPKKRSLYIKRLHNAKSTKDIDVLTMIDLMYKNKDEYFESPNSDIQMDCNFTEFTDYSGKFLINEDAREFMAKKPKKYKNKARRNPHNKKKNNETPEPENPKSQPTVDEDWKPNSFSYDKVLFADFETTTDGEFHKPYLLCSLEERKNLKPSNPPTNKELGKFLSDKEKEYRKLLGVGANKKLINKALMIEQKKKLFCLDGDWKDYNVKVFRSIDYKDDKIKFRNGRPIGMIQDFLDKIANDFFDRHENVANGEKTIKVLIHFHNLGYDDKFLIQGLDFLHTSPTVIKKSRSNTVSIKIRHNNVDFTFVDSLGKIPSPLGEFDDMFKLPSGKIKNFPYHKFNTDAMEEEKLYVSKDEWEKDWECIHDKNDYFEKDEENDIYCIDHWKYAIDYCCQDILTQRNGYIIFKSWIEVFFGNDINYDNILTIGSLSMAIQKKQGVFNGVWEFTGKTGAFLQEAVIGGRTMAALHDEDDKIGAYRAAQLINYDEEKHSEKSFLERNYEDTDEKNIENSLWKRLIDVKDSNPSMKTRIKKRNPKYKKTIVYDIDKISLYASAMIKMPGYVCGKPVEISQKRLNNRSFKKSNHYVVQIKIKKVGKRLRIPLLSKKFSKEDEKDLRVKCAGNRNWTNDMEGEILIVDKYTLEDLERFHEIEWEPMFGLEFIDNPFNPKINDFMKEMFEVRNFFKKIKNPAQLIFKLIMNAGYGKTIERARLVERDLFLKETVGGAEVHDLKWIHQKFAGQIELITDYGIFNQVTYRKSFVEHYNMPHCGGMVLSWSKRIMEEFMAPIDDEILYTDTDSMFITQEGFDRIMESYPELIGEGIEQFHNDIPLKGTNQRIIEGQWILPKCYYVVAINDEGEKMVIVKVKGFPTQAVNRKITIDFYGNVTEFFNAIRYWGKGVCVNIADGKVRFHHTASGEIKTVYDFIRRLRVNY